ncbi:hypothetical protein REPUB_Repub11eG0138500 [Reevesia pubescens]
MKKQREMKLVQQLLWHPLPQGIYKVNSDRAFDNGEKACGIGVVIKDSQGYVMGAHIEKLVLTTDPFMTKAKVANKALEFAWEMGFTDIIWREIHFQL